MGSLVINSGGLGTYLVSDCNAPLVAGVAPLIDCDSLSNFFHSACWGMCTDQTVASMAAGLAPAQTLNVTTPVAPGSPADLTALPDTTGAAAQALSNAALLQTQTNNAAANPAVTDQCQNFTSSWPISLTCNEMLLAGVGIFAAVLILPRLIR